jgi:hypothetical protein
MTSVLRPFAKCGVLLACCWFGTSCGSLGASEHQVSGCGLALVPPPNVRVSLHGKSPESCESTLQLEVDPRPGYLEEENLLEVSGSSFHQIVEASGRFKKTSRGYEYVYSPASGEAGDGTQLLGKLATEEVDRNGLNLVIGMASVRVTASPYKMWPSDEIRSVAERKYGIAQHGLILDCAYGIAGTQLAAVTASACVPRSKASGMSATAIIRRLLDSVRWD